MINALEHPELANDQNKQNQSQSIDGGENNNLHNTLNDDSDKNELSNDYFFQNYALMFSTLNETITCTIYKFYKLFSTY